MPTPKLAAVLASFKKNAQASLSLAKEATRYKEPRKGKDRPILESRLCSINELSFLKLFISWEYFLEQTFIRFMCGAHNSVGLPTEKYVSPRTLQHALDLIKQQQRYADWTIGSEVVNKAKLYFKDGEPFTAALGGSLTDLADMKTIRNRIVHESRETDTAFRKFVRQKLGFWLDGTVPGKLLMLNVPTTSVKTLLEQYGSVLSAAADILDT